MLKTAFELPYEGVSEIRGDTETSCLFRPESTENRKSKRVGTGAGQANFPGELIDSIAPRLSAIYTYVSRGLEVCNFKRSLIVYFAFFCLIIE